MVVDCVCTLVGSDTVTIGVEVFDIITFDALLSAGVSYIIACGEVVWAAPTIFTPLVG